LVNANNGETAVTFEYGTTTSYGNTVDGTPNTVSGNSFVAVSSALTGLTPNITYNYRVKAVNSLGTTYGSNKTFNLQLFSLPVYEDFSSSALPSGWSTENIGEGITERWSISNTYNASGVSNELKCSYIQLNPGITRIITPAIYTVGVSGITLNFKHMFDDYGTGATVRIQSSNDMQSWTNETWSILSNSNSFIGPETIITTITNNLNSNSTYIAFTIEGDLYQFDYWYIDDVSITSGISLSVPIVSTTEVSSITSASAASGGNVTSDGGAVISARGVCWSTMANPTIALSTKTVNGAGYGTFTSTISDISASTTYHVRAYATNSVGTAYGSDITFSTVGTGIDKQEAVGYYLGQNVPNPFYQSTTIGFALVKGGNVKLSIFNTLGQEVDVIVDEFLSAGSYTRQWIPKGVPSGIYFYQLNVNGFKEVKRLMRQ